MVALKEFANFITLNTVNLAATFARLLAESRAEFATLPQSTRTALGRKLLKAAAEACQQQTSEPLLKLFADPTPRWAGTSAPAHPLTEVECLGQTLSPIVTNLEAGKFLWQTLFELRAAVLEKQPAPPFVLPPLNVSSAAEAVGDHSLLQLLIDNLPDHIYIKDANSRFLLANHAVQRHLGASTPQEVIGKTDFDFSPPELAEQYYAEEQALFKAGQSFVGHEQPIYDHETDTTRWVSSTKVLFKDAEGNIAGLVGLNRDITELRQTRQDLTKFKLGIDNSTDAIFLTDVDGKIIYVNAAFEKVYGFTRAEALGKTPRILKSGLISQERYAEFWAALLNKQVVAGEIINKTKDGRLVTVEVSNNPILDESDSIIGFLAMHRDVTERKQVDASLAKRAAELETVAQVSVAASTILDTRKLIQEVADLTKERFGLYHAHIYLLNPETEILELAAGAGEIGRQMLNQGWQIPLNKELSLVARAARAREAVVVNNVLENAGYFPNPLLPDTRSEMAVPIIAGDTLVGVLDVQANKVDYFTDDDRRVQLALAAQVAVALRNARLYEQIQAALADVQQSQHLLRNVIDATPDWILVTDRQHRYRLVNSSYAASLKMKPEDVVGKTALEVGLPEEIVKGDPVQGIRGFWVDDDEVMAGGQTRVVDREPSVVDGKPVYLSSVKVPLKNEQGEVWGLLGYVRDITEHEQLLADTKQRAQESMVTKNIAAAINADTRLAATLPFVADQLQELLPTDILCLAEYTPQSTELTLYTVGVNAPPELFDPQGVRLPLDNNCAGWVISHNEAWIEDDLREAKRFVEDDPLAALQMAARLVIPLQMGPEVVGALYLINAQPGAYTEENLAILWQIADQMAPAIERVHLFEQVQRRAHREQTIREITEKMRAATSMEQLVKITATEIGQRFSAAYTLVDLGTNSAAKNQAKNGNSQTEQVAELEN